MENRDLTVGGVCQQQSFLSNGPRLCEAVEKMATVRIRVKRLIILSNSLFYIQRISSSTSL